MIFPIFASVLVFCAWLAYEIHKSKKKTQKSAEAFWDKEAKANATPKKSLDDLNYITIPDEIVSLSSKDFTSESGENSKNNGDFSSNSNNGDPDKIIISDATSEHALNEEGIPNDVSDALTLIQTLKNSKIVNLSNISNTDLKLSYGAANLPVLTEYDQNYLSLSRALICISEYALHIGRKDIAKLILEFIIATGNDSISAYKSLAGIYVEENDKAKISYLESAASLLTGLTKGPIMNYLNGLDSSDKDLEESIYDILE